MLQDVVVCRALVGMAAVLGFGHLCGWTLWPCFFARATGLPCPGCGLTRGVTALFHGEWQKSWAYHPFTLGFVLLGALMTFCAVAPGGVRTKVAGLVERLEKVTPFATIFLLAVVIYGLLRMGGICSSGAALDFRPLIWQTGR